MWGAQNIKQTQTPTLTLTHSRFLMSRPNANLNANPGSEDDHDHSLTNENSRCDTSQSARGVSENGENRFHTEQVPEHFYYQEKSDRECVFVCVCVDTVFLGGSFASEWVAGGRLLSNSLRPYSIVAAVL